MAFFNHELISPSLRRGLLLGAALLFAVSVAREAEAADECGSLAKAEKARATIVAASGKGLAFDFSIKGLADGLAALKN